MANSEIPRQPVESSNIASIGYDPTSKILAIEFKSGGCHHYAGVTPEVYAGFLSADSKGKFFHATVRGKFDSRKLEEEQ